MGRGGGVTALPRRNSTGGQREDGHPPAQGRGPAAPEIRSQAAICVVARGMTAEGLDFGAGSFPWLLDPDLGKFSPPGKRKIVLAHRLVTWAYLREDNISMTSLAFTKGVYLLFPVQLCKVGLACNPSEPRFYHTGNGPHNLCVPHLTELPRSLAR